ncbi:STAS domain-containing protein [Microaerobacter geothermalis]|uniref:STAS domain-containing protein n=1 Tax=Microaerobacter geothermalis TaxID=674972 RepID=UPI002E379387|nr:STAS domain-containing protein [Microaerobacter geothermalis]
METQLISLVKKNTEQIISEWNKQMTIHRGELQLQNTSDEDFGNSNEEFVRLIIKALSTSGEERNILIKDFAKKKIILGWPIIYLTQGLHLFKKVFIRLIDEGDDNSCSLTLKTFNEVDDWVGTITHLLMKEYIGSWEHTVKQQQIALRELSAPVIPVFEGISVLPLIGSIDTERARQIMENLLNGIIRHETKVVLIDITGVPMVDAMVAHHIIRAAEAARLIGSMTILVGIRPEIAQTIIHSGINLQQFMTCSSLRNGITLALQMTGKSIVDRGRE